MAATKTMLSPKLTSAYLTSPRDVDEYGRLEQPVGALSCIHETSENTREDHAESESGRSSADTNWDLILESCKVNAWDPWHTEPMILISVTETEI